VLLKEQQDEDDEDDDVEHDAIPGIGAMTGPNSSTAALGTSSMGNTGGGGGGIGGGANTCAVMTSLLTS